MGFKREVNSDNLTERTSTSIGMYKPTWICCILVYSVILLINVESVSALIEGISVIDLMIFLRRGGVARMGTHEVEEVVEVTLKTKAFFRGLG